ncbi:hypothetical protein ICL81_08970 [Leucobacter sp. cx-328]|uniref:DUF6541 family protein n=1 Tax=unclassified Leucobacter TaxID=2621730 RepID=UPI00165D3910|nr:MULTISPECIES: DUF6541 family protein [unclassified Leucobacter]MBC9944637.1 hypothetical protein [Leucobacter sp. cx-328]
MLQWLALVLPVVTMLGLIAVLGLPIAFALRARGFSVLLISIPAAFAVLALSSFIAPFLGIFWTVLPAIGLTVVLTVVLFALRPFMAIQRKGSSAHSSGAKRFWIPTVAAAIGGLTITASVVLAIKSPDAISQTYDVNFHLNAVQKILDEGSAAPYDMDLSAPGAKVFYPTLWHGLVALIVQLSSVSIPLATNAALFATIAIIWTVGMVGFGRAIAGPSARVSFISGVLSVAIPSFPLSLTGYGILYPNLLAFALIPYFLIAFMQLFGIAKARRSDMNSMGSALLLLFGSFGAVVLAHPNGMHAILVWLIGPSLYLLIRAIRGANVPQRTGELGAALLSKGPRISLAALGCLGLFALIIVAWYVGRTSDAPWGGDKGPKGALLDAIGMSPHLEGHVWPVSLLMLVGFVVVIRLTRMRWLFVPGVLFLALYIISDGFPPSEWRTFFLTPWYNTPWRLSALVWMGVFPFIVLGASLGWSALRGGLVRWARLVQRPKFARIGGSALAVLFLLAATQGAGAHAGIQYVSSKYEKSGPNAVLLDVDERAVLERLSETLPENAVIIDNPWNGGALAYAISGIPVLTPHTGGNYDPRIAELTSELKYGTPRSCELVEQLGARYILDFGTKYVFPGTKRAEPFLGITDVGESDMFTEIDREGDAVVYEVTGCDISQ